MANWEVKLAVNRVPCAPEDAPAYWAGMAWLACPHLHTVAQETGGPEPWEKREVVQCIDCGEEVHPIHPVNPDVADLPL